jgi:chemotaxis-related protein WspB
MLYVLFQIGNDRYALEASRVVEVVPFLTLKRLPQAPQGVAGMFVYRGQPVPAVDLCALMFGRAAPERLSTRIIVINYGEAGGAGQLLGLIAERATETMRRDAREFKDVGVSLPATPYLGPVLMDEKGVIQLVHTESLLTGNIRELLFAAIPESGRTTT